MHFFILSMFSAERSPNDVIAFSYGAVLSSALSRVFSKKHKHVGNCASWTAEALFLGGFLSSPTMFPRAIFHDIFNSLVIPWRR